MIELDDTSKIEYEPIFSAIEKKELFNLLKIVKDGGTLKTFQINRFESLKLKLQPAQDPTPEDSSRIIVSGIQLYNFFGISAPAFQMRMKIDGFPKDARISNRLWDLKMVNDWTLSHFYASAEGDEKGLADEKLRQARAKADMLEMERDTITKTLVRSDLVSQDLSILFTGMKQRLLGWFKKLPPLLVEKDVKAMGAVIRREVIDLLTDLSKGMDHINPKPKKAKKAKKGKK